MKKHDLESKNLAGQLQQPRLVGDSSEAEILRHIFPRLKSRQNAFEPDASRVLIGPGDDSAVVDFATSEVVISTDTLVCDLDFRLEWPNGYKHSGYDVGWKAVTQNVSDIASMGAIAKFMTVSLSLPHQAHLTWVEDLADGIRQASSYYADQYGSDISIIGGDLSGAQEISVAITIFGVMPYEKTSRRKPLVRSNAQESDIIAVGPGQYPLGSAARALHELDRHNSRSGLKQLLPQLLPCPYFSVLTDEDFSAHAMIDLSDGLVHEIDTVIKASSKPGRLLSAVLDDSELKKCAGILMRQYDIDQNKALDSILYGGEDYLLLGFFSPDQKLPEGFSQVGVVKKQPQPKNDHEKSYKTVESKYVKDMSQVFDHFVSSF